MTLNLIAHRTSPQGVWHCSFLSANPPMDSQKATAFIGHPSDRRALAGRRLWKVTLPDSASLQEDMVIWFDDEQFRMLTACEVFEFARERLHDFSCVEG